MNTPHGNGEMRSAADILAHCGTGFDGSSKIPASARHALNSVKIAIPFLKESTLSSTQSDHPTSKSCP
jgi:hypothetical protein